MTDHHKRESIERGERLTDLRVSVRRRSTGAYLAKARVALIDKRGGMTLATADHAGMAHFYDVEPGDYSVCCVSERSVRADITCDKREMRVTIYSGNALF